MSRSFSSRGCLWFIVGFACYKKHSQYRPQETDMPGEPLLDVKLPSRSGSSVTIQDIARALNISHTTVSRALADSPKISTETKLRVRHAVEQLGYVPSASARMMRGARSSVIGLVIPDLENDFYATVAQTVADALAARSMQLLLSVTDDDSDRELRELRGLLETRPAGVIIVPTATPRPETAALLKHLETIQLIRKHESLGAHSVLINDREGTFAATQHLITYGHQRIAFIGGDVSLSTGRNRLAGFQAALKEHRLEATATALGAPRPEFARYAVTSMMTASVRPTALVFGSAELTLGALQALHALKLEWPRDVSVVGYHDPAWFELTGGGITTVRLPVREIATTATGVLLSRAIGKSENDAAEEAPVNVEFMPTLVLRGSTAPYRGA
jgi:LacI family transcriptional regulator